MSSIITPSIWPENDPTVQKSAARHLTVIHTKRNTHLSVRWSLWYVLSGFVRRLAASQHLTGCRSPLARFETIPGVTAPKITFMLCARDPSLNARCIIHHSICIVKQFMKYISYEKWNELHIANNTKPLVNHEWVWASARFNCRRFDALVASQRRCSLPAEISTDSQKRIDKKCRKC